jgi:ADP-heptose:LPS heptosyltransferase
MLQNRAGDLVRAAEVMTSDLVDRFIDYTSDQGKKGTLRDQFQLWQAIRRERFDAAVYLIISERSKVRVWRDRLFFRSCGISSLFGFHSFSTEILFPKDPDGRPAATDSEAVRKLKRLELDGIRWDPSADLKAPLMSFSAEERASVDGWLSERRRNLDSPLIAIAPGTKKPACAWPTENFIELGRRLLGAMDCELIVVGGASETAIGEQMVAAWGKGVNSAGAFSVHGSAMLLSACDLYIGVDTGTTHLAAAAGTPWFAIFHQRDNPGQWYPLGNGYVLLSEPVECAGCALFQCPIPGHPCMKGISVDSAWDSLKVFISNVFGESNASFSNVSNSETKELSRA